MKRIIALLFAILMLVAPVSRAANHADPRKPIIYGICRKPFPALFALDYPLCRAAAWLAALEMAASRLPSGADLRLRQQGIATSLGSLAIAALICPLDVVTPEHAPGESIRVFLSWPDDPLKELDSLPAQPQNLLYEMAVIWETASAIERLRKIWPASVPDAGRRMPELEMLSKRLQSLWQAGVYMAGKSQALPESQDSAIISLLAARRRPDQQRLENVLEQLFAREATDTRNAQLWSRLASQALYLRGLCHERREQFALAEADFDAALARLKKTGAEDDLNASIYLARGNVRGLRHNEAGMCADYAAACALGQCQSLSLARREGLCANGKQ